MSESKIEKKFKDEIEKLGGKCRKFISPGCNGMPDRIVTFKKGIIFFVELKAPGEPLKPLQVIRKKELEGDGFLVFKIDSLEGVERFIKEILPSILLL